MFKKNDIICITDSFGQIVSCVITEVANTDYGVVYSAKDLESNRIFGITDDSVVPLLA